MASGRVSPRRGKVLDIPNPPTIGTATAGGESVSIAFTAYSGGAGGPTRSYIAKSNPGNITATGSTSPISVTGLTVGTSYTISVAGVNETGTGEYSSASVSAVPIEATSYESIATYTVGSGGSSSITFSSIPSTYTHLQLRYLAKASGSGTRSNVNVYINSTVANTNSHRLFGDGSSVVADNTGTPYFAVMVPRTDSYANMFGGGVIDFLDYANTNKNKTIRGAGGYDVNGAGAANLASAFWNSTSAISQIILQPDSGNFTQYSHFALYGIKGV